MAFTVRSPYVIPTFPANDIFLIIVANFSFSQHMQTVTLRGSTWNLQPAPLRKLLSHKLYVARGFRAFQVHLDDLFFFANHKVCNVYAALTTFTILAVLIPLTS